MYELYNTSLGRAYVGDSHDLLASLDNNSVDLIITSPPFPLQRKKEYGNKNEDEYVDWLIEFAHDIYRVLKETGSFVLDLGGAYKKRRPVRSLYNFRILIKMCDEYGFNLAEEFYWHNPAKLPSPIEWVNKRKIRAKDSVNTVWWFSKSDFPKADIRKVLVGILSPHPDLRERHLLYQILVFFQRRHEPWPLERIEIVDILRPAHDLLHHLIQM